MCRETAKYQSYCNDTLLILIYCKPVAIGRIKLVVSNNGVEKTGEKIYRNPPESKDDDFVEKIRQLYKSYYELNIIKIQ